MHMLNELRQDQRIEVLGILKKYGSHITNTIYGDYVIQSVCVCVYILVAS